MLAIVVAVMGLVSLVVAGGGGGRPEGIAIAVVAGLVLGALLVSLDKLADLFVDQTAAPPRRGR
jgi:4-hydroxybenzoate polyprenyltransferase